MLCLGEEVEGLFSYRPVRGNRLEVRAAAALRPEKWLALGAERRSCKAAAGGKGFLIELLFCGCFEMLYVGKHLLGLSGQKGRTSTSKRG